MSGTEYVYQTYIKTTPDQLWAALTDPAQADSYWGCTRQTDWAVGSPVTWERGPVTITDPDQVVLESEPGRTLAYTWHTFTPEFGDSVGLSRDAVAQMAAEPRSRVRFGIEPVGDTVKLTMTHDGFEPDSTVLGGISDGWPRVLSSLKTMLETGQALPGSKG
jgi:uncharacterized protein YndB with AHSA1/START domain